MKTEKRTALALINLTTGGFYLKDGRLYHDDLGELPSVEEIAAVVKQNPEEIADILLDDAVNESLPVELDTPTVRRITAGAGTVADVEALTEARAEASRRVFSIGQQLMDEAGESTAEVAVEIILAFARGGCALQEDEGFKLLGGDSILPEHQTVTAALDREPGKVAALLRFHCESIGIVPKKSDVFALSAQLAGYHHSDLCLGLDELKTAMKPKKEFTYAMIEEAAQLLIQLAKKGYAYKGKSIVNLADTSEILPETDFGIIDRALAVAPCAVADLLFEEIEEIPDEIGEAIEAGEAWEKDVFALCELMVMRNA